MLPLSSSSSSLFRTQNYPLEGTRRSSEKKQASIGGFLLLLLPPFLSLSKSSKKNLSALEDIRARRPFTTCFPPLFLSVILLIETYPLLPICSSFRFWRGGGVLQAAQGDSGCCLPCHRCLHSCKTA